MQPYKFTKLRTAVQCPLKGLTGTSKKNKCNIGWEFGQLLLFSYKVEMTPAPNQPKTGLSIYGSSNKFLSSCKLLK